MLKALLVAPLALLPMLSAQERSIKYLEPERRIVFLGDSNTFAGHYIVHVEAALRSRFSDKRFELINLGLPSETASGLSEPDHPFPRPSVHERLDRALEKTKPAVVFACYGTNDGIYYPFSDERFAAYKHGIGKLIDKIQAVGARLVLLTPPPLDPLPLKPRGKLLPAGRDKYAWFAIYEKYDEEVLARYAAWILQQGNRVDQVIDIRTPMLSYVQEQRAAKPEFSMANDGIHFNEQGHRLIARAILQACHIEPREPAKALEKLVAERQVLFRDAWLSHVGHKRPGMKEGRSLDEARQRAKLLDAKIGAIVD